MKIRYYSYTRPLPNILKNVAKNNLELNIKEATSTLLEIARNSCWNNISENTGYIISEIKNDSRNFKTQRIAKNKENRKKKPISLEKATAELKSIYEKIYDINLKIYKSQKDKTIIDIQYYLKSALEPDHFEIMKNNPPMLHCKVGIPPYLNDKTKKYDVNWELGGIRNEWNSFWNKLKSNMKFSYVLIPFIIIGCHPIFCNWDNGYNKINKEINIENIIGTYRIKNTRGTFPNKITLLESGVYYTSETNNTYFNNHGEWLRVYVNEENIIDLDTKVVRFEKKENKYAILFSIGDPDNCEGLIYIKE